MAETIQQLLASLPNSEVRISLEKLINTMMSNIREFAHTNGFLFDQDGSVSNTLSFTDSTRTFTITPTAGESHYFIDSIKYTFSQARSVQISDTEGVHWIYFDKDGVLKSTEPGSEDTYTLIHSTTLVGNVYWDATNNKGILVGNERHGSLMSPSTHYHFHEVFGSLFETGLSFSGFDVDGTGNAATNAQFDLDSGEFHDEDISHEIQAELNVTIPTFYKPGVSGLWRRLEATTGYPVADGTIDLRLDWNDYNGGNWRLQEVPNNTFVCTHYFATNDPNTPIIGVMGESTYDNANQARSGAETEILDIQYNGLPLVEWVILATVIWQTNDSYTNQVAAKIISTTEGENYIDWRQSRALSSTGGGTSDHEALDNLQGGAIGEHYHLTAAEYSWLQAQVP